MTKLKRVPNAICNIIYVLSGLAFIGWGCGVEEATSILGIFRNVVLAIISMMIFVKMHYILKKYGR